MVETLTSSPPQLRNAFKQGGEAGLQAQFNEFVELYDDMSLHEYLAKDNRDGKGVRERKHRLGPDGNAVRCMMHARSSFVFQDPVFQSTCGCRPEHLRMPAKAAEHLRSPLALEPKARAPCVSCALAAMQYMSMGNVTTAGGLLWQVQRRGTPGRSTMWRP